MPPTLPRRLLFRGLAAAPLAAAATPVLARGAAPSALPAVASLRIGRVTVHFLSDGPNETPLDWWPGAPPAEIARRVAAVQNGDTRSLWLNITAWLVDDGERLVLIDTGAGNDVFPLTGRLLVTLRALGVAPRDIDIVAITHTHFDHLSGLVADGRPVFPEAELLLPRADALLFTDPGRRAAAPEFLHSSFDLTMAAVRAYRRTNRVDPGQAITPYITSVDLNGHTPGHTGFRISDGGQTLLISADVLFSPAIHPDRDDIGIAFEVDREAARRMRRRLFDQAVEEHALLASAHMPFPGLGHIVREGGRLAWVPAYFPQFTPPLAG